MTVDVDLALAVLPDTGGVVVLADARHAWAWIWSLADLGTHLAFRLGLPRRPQSSTEVRADGGRAQRSLLRTVTWLSGVLNDLIDVAELPFPTASA
ncbi:hypothetical protein ACFXPA_38165 [Amycolatopsis sp. NPDC059090]|uniref:hypothetical protein n=1 Tax=Amycolatopsis sp. NPDC059090 TaxID=3346723 RepID=UPI00366B9E8A